MTDINSQTNQGVSTPPTPQRIIIVEDDFQLANSYKGKLSDEGYQVDIVADRDAVSAITSQKPDLVLLDIFMPNVSGLSILRELRSSLEFETLPILILTNDAKASDMEEAIKLGVDGYILKAETDLGLLAQNVKKILSEKKNSQHVAQT